MQPANLLKLSFINEKELNSSTLKVSKRIKKPLRAQTTFLKTQKFKTKKIENKKQLKSATTRFILYYADDNVEKSMRVKNQIRNINTGSRNSTCEIHYPGLLKSEQFKQTLREREGIFFDLNISPSSPRKRSSDESISRELS